MKRIFNLMLMGLVFLVAINGFASATLAKFAKDVGKSAIIIHDVADAVNCLTGIERKEVFKSNYAYQDFKFEPVFIEKPEQVFNHFSNYSSVIHNKEIKARNLLLKQNTNILYLRKFANRNIS